MEQTPPAAPMSEHKPLTERERYPYLLAIEQGAPRLGEWNWPDMMKRLLERYDAAEALLATTTQERDAAVEAATQRGKDLHEALEALSDMYLQYCGPGPFGHDFMSAGEGSQDVLAKWDLFREDWSIISPAYDTDVPEKVKALLSPSLDIDLDESPAPSPEQA
ncbi:hypothetical protein [Hymenobacter coalescens]